MDHYCLWVNNAVGHYNHKYFLGFVFWKAVASIVSIPCMFISLYISYDPEMKHLALGNPNL